MEGWVGVDVGWKQAAVGELLNESGANLLAPGRGKFWEVPVTTRVTLTLALSHSRCGTLPGITNVKYSLHTIAAGQALI